MLRSFVALSLCLLALDTTGRAEVPQSVMEAIGGSTAISLYTSHTVIGMAANADHSSEEKIKAAAMSVGGAVGGLHVVEQQLRAAAKDLPENDAAQLNGFADITADVQKEGTLLIDALKAKKAGDKAAVEKAMAGYADARKVAAGKIKDAAGIPAEMLE